jgi:N-acetylglutamate synthase/N-acetylornithine aminotransferase
MFPEVDEPGEQEQENASTELASVGPQEGPGQTQALIMAVQGMRHELDALQRARQISAVTLVGLGVCIGLLFMLAVIVLAWLYGG